ncbi:MAG: hypothetical protein Q9170_004425 [Blastenia crenularia]
MVTGMESAGLVLAAFPLVVKGLNVYIDGIQKVQRLRHCRQVLESFSSRLSSQSAFFRQSFEELFAAADILDAERIDESLENIDDPFWKDERREKALQEFLGASFQPYVQTTRTLHQSITDLGHKLRLYLGPKRQLHGLRGSLFSIQLKMDMILKTMSIKAFNDILKDIQMDNWTIWRLHHGSEYLATKARSRRLPKWRFVLMREQVSNLGSALAKSRCRNSRCQHNHDIGLRIHTDSELKEIGEHGQAPLPSQTYGLLSSIDSNSQGGSFQQSRRVRWRELEIVPQGFEEWPCQTKARRLWGTLLEQDEPGNGKSYRDCSSIAAGLASEEIKDFCAMMCRINGEGGKTLAAWKPMGHLKGDEISTNAEPHHVVHVTAENEKPRTATLEWILQQCADKSSGFILPMRERLSMSVALATATLQCVETVWLKSDWTSEDIIAQYESCPTGDRRVFRNVQMSLKWKPADIRRSARSNPFKSEEDSKNFFGCETIVALGMALIELFLGDLLLSKYKSRQEGFPESKTRLEAANDLMGYIGIEASNNYAMAVERCLRCSWTRQPDMYGIDEAFEKTICHNILEPLAKDFANFCG